MRQAQNSGYQAEGECQDQTDDRDLQCDQESVDQRTGRQMAVFDRIEVDRYAVPLPIVSQFFDAPKNQPAQSADNGHIFEEIKQEMMVEKSGTA
jgi:hypothetical protein